MRKITDKQRLDFLQRHRRGLNHIHGHWGFTLCAPNDYEKDIRKIIDAEIKRKPSK